MCREVSEEDHSSTVSNFWEDKNKGAAGKEIDSVSFLAALNFFDLTDPIFFCVIQRFLLVPHFIIGWLFGSGWFFCLFLFVLPGQPYLDGTFGGETGREECRCDGGLSQ